MKDLLSKVERELLKRTKIWKGWIKFGLYIDAVYKARDLWLVEVFKKELDKDEAIRLWITKYPQIIKEIYEEKKRQVWDIFKIDVITE